MDGGVNFVLVLMVGKVVDLVNYWQGGIILLVCLLSNFKD